MAGSLSIDKEACIVLSIVPYNDGRSVVRVMGESLGTVALWVPEGKGKNRQIGKWHPGAQLELRGLRRTGSEGLIRFKEAHRMGIPQAILGDARRSAVVFFLCELLLKLLPSETANPEVFALFQTTLNRLEEEQKVGWVHVEFVGQLIRLMGIAPTAQPRASCDVLDLMTGEWMEGFGMGEDQLDAPISQWFSMLCSDGKREFACSAEERKLLVKSQLRYLFHQMGGFREIKSYEVLETVFE